MRANTRYSHLTDAEFERVVYAELDDLTTTDKEHELHKRFAALLEGQSEVEGYLALDAEYVEAGPAKLRELLESHSATTTDMTAMLEVLNDEDIGDAGTLRKILTRDKQLTALASDAGDVFDRLNNLMNDAQE